MSEKQRMSLTMQIMVAMVIGALTGLVLNQFTDVGWIDTYIVSGMLHALGAIFIAALKMMVVPLVFVSLVGGVTALGNLSALGRMRSRRGQARCTSLDRCTARLRYTPSHPVRSRCRGLRRDEPAHRSPESLPSFPWRRSAHTVLSTPTRSRHDRRRSPSRILR